MEKIFQFVFSQKRRNKLEKISFLMQENANFNFIKESVFINKKNQITYHLSTFMRVRAC